MPPRSVRFRPPPVALPPPAAWALARAFGPPEVPRETPADPAAATAALDFARRLEIAARLAARLPRDRWRDELGEAGAAGLRRERTSAVAAEVRLLDLGREVAGVAAACGTPVVLLKFAAMAASGAAAPGSRPACDVDLLAPAAGAREIHSVLLARGWSPSPLAAGDHQLAALAAPAGGAVEIHLHLPGVRVAARSATYEDLHRAGLLGEAPGWPEGCRVPVREVLAAHALAHGIAQHGFAPDAYGLLRMVGDLADLGLGDVDGGQLSGRAWDLAASAVSREEVAAVRDLVRALAAGEDLTAPLAAEGRPADAVLLLRHALAGRLDPRYRAALKLGLRPQPGDRSRFLAAARLAWSTLVLSDARIDAIYGPPAARWGRWGYWGRRLARPADVAWRLVRYAGAARRRPRPPGAGGEGAAARSPASEASRILPPR